MLQVKQYADNLNIYQLPDKAIINRHDIGV